MWGDCFEIQCSFEKTCGGDLYADDGVNGDYVKAGSGNNRPVVEVRVDIIGGYDRTVCLNC